MTMSGSAGTAGSGDDGDTRHSRARDRRRIISAIRSPAGNRVLIMVHYTTIALLAWLPLPIGGHADWAASLSVSLVGLLLLVWCVVAWRFSVTLNVPLVLPPAALLIVGVVGWSVLQATPGILPAGWIHPLWVEAAADGLPVEPTVSLNRSASFDALNRLLGTCGMFLLAFALAQRETQARQLLLAILAIVTVYAALGILRQLIGWRLGEGPSHGGNVVSTFVNRNHFATYANLGLVIALGLMLEPLLRGKVTKQGHVGARIAQAIASIFEERRRALVAAVVILLASIGSASRGGLLSLAGAGFFLLAIMFLVSRAKHGTKFLAVAASLGLGGLLVWLTGDALLSRFETILAADTLGEVDGRIAAWKMTLAAIAERPLLGYGHGAYQELFLLKHDPELGRIGIFDHAHNDYLQAVAELGLPAAGALLIALLMLWGLCIAGAVTRRRRLLYPLVASASGVLVGLHAVTDFSLLMPAVAMTFAAILGIGCAQSRPR
jgi:O-antigen ligase